MRFKTRDEFITSGESEKLTLVHVHARKRLYTFVGTDAPVYSKSVPYFVSEVKNDSEYLTRVFTNVSMPEGSFYYDILTSTLYVRNIDDTNPKDIELIVTYRFFFSNVGINNTYDLSDNTDEVFYDGRIKSSPGYNHKIGIDQSLTSLIGTGSLVLSCQDGDLDEIFDTMIFENQRVEVYSWNRDLKPSEAKKIYSGRITNKTFDTNQLSFTIKDQLYDLLASPVVSPYSDSDTVVDSAKGQYKRLIYGRLDGLRGQGIDQVVEGYYIPGIASATVLSNVLTGTGTAFLTDLFQNDEITLGTQTFTVEKVVSDVELILNDEPDFSFSNRPIRVVPDRGSTAANRRFQFAGHPCAKVTRTITNVKQLNRIQVDSTEGLFEGDFIEINASFERIEIKNIAPNNIVVLVQNMIVRPGVGTTITRQPVQRVYLEGVQVPSGKYAIINDTRCMVMLDNDVEFSVARERSTPFEMNFTNGSLEVTYTAGGDVSIAELFQPMDWIKPNSPTYTTYYQISSIQDTSIFLTKPFLQPTITESVDYKQPEYLTDESVVSCDILGMTEDGTETGEWISTASQANKSLLNMIGVTNINEQSFLDGEIDAKQLISLAIPYSFDDKSLPTVKTILDDLNKSVSASLTLDNDLKIKFKVVNVFVTDAMPVIDDFDVIDWNIKATNGKLYKKVLAQYRPTDTDRSTLDEGFKLVDFESEFINKYIEAGTTNNLELKLYKTLEAEIITHRNSYNNRLSVSTLTVKTDLRLENLQMGEVVVVDFSRLYKRFGDSQSRKKVMLVTAKNVDGEGITFEFSDLGNTFNTSSYITPNDAPEWSAASEAEKLVYGYITDNQGIVDDDEETANTHLIS